MHVNKNIKLLNTFQNFVFSDIHFDSWDHRGILIGRIETERELKS